MFDAFGGRFMNLDGQLAAIGGVIVYLKGG